MEKSLRRGCRPFGRALKPARLVGYFDFSEGTRNVMRPGWDFKPSHQRAVWRHRQAKKEAGSVNCQPCWKYRDSAFGISIIRPNRQCCLLRHPRHPRRYSVLRARLGQDPQTQERLDTPLPHKHQRRWRQQRPLFQLLHSDYHCDYLSS